MRQSLFRTCQTLFLFLLFVPPISASADGMATACGAYCQSAASPAPWPTARAVTATPLTMGGLNFQIPGQIRRLGYLEHTAAIALSEGRTLGITLEDRSDLATQYRYLKASATSVQEWVRLIFDVPADAAISRSGLDQDVVREIMRLKPSYFADATVRRYTKGSITVYRVDESKAGRATLIVTRADAPQQLVTVVLNGFRGAGVIQFLNAILPADR